MEHRSARIDRVPHGKRHAEEALAADAPVARQPVHPILEPGPHVRRVPFELPPTREQRVAVLDRADEPLTARHDLHRALALLEELHRARHRRRLADQLARLPQHLHHPLARLVDGAAAQLLIARARALQILGLPAGRPPGYLRQTTVEGKDRAHRQPQLAPPHHIGQIAERADHHQARALLRLDQRMGQHGHARAEQRRQHLPAHQPALALVVGVGQQRHARRDQLRARCLDQRLGGLGVFPPTRLTDLNAAHPRLANDAVRRSRTARAVTVGQGKAHPVHRARALAVLELGLRDRGLEVNVPQRRRLQLVGPPTLEQTQERALRDAPCERADRRVGHRPVDRQPQRAPERLERLLVGLRQRQAQLDEVRPRDGYGFLPTLLCVEPPATLRAIEQSSHEVGVVGHRRVAAHAEVVLHAPLGRQAVVVPAHRVEHGLAAHPLIARDRVGVRVGEDVPDVQRPADRRRRRVDREDPLAWGAAVEAVDAIALPRRAPLLLEPVERGPLGDSGTVASVGLLLRGQAGIVSIGSRRSAYVGPS